MIHYKKVIFIVIFNTTIRTYCVSCCALEWHYLHTCLHTGVKNSILFKSMFMYVNTKSTD